MYAIRSYYARRLWLKLKKNVSTCPALSLKLRHHVNISAEIIENFEGLRHLKEIILYHHEKMDGSGYPRA